MIKTRRLHNIHLGFASCSLVNVDILTLSLRIGSPNCSTLASCNATCPAINKQPVRECAADGTMCVLHLLPPPPPVATAAPTFSS